MSLMHKIIKKYKDEGLQGVMKGGSRTIRLHLNLMMLARYQKRYPVQENLIVLESDGDLTDNAYAVFDFMVHHGYLAKYHVIWAVKNVEKAARHKFPNTEYIQKSPYVINPAWAKAFATCRWFIYDHWNLMESFHKRKGQMSIFLTHGTGVKAPSKQGPVKSHCDIFTALSPFSAKMLSNFSDEPIEKAAITGYPRLDYFYHNDSRVKKQVLEMWHFDKYKKVIFWMPTFRQSTLRAISEDYIHNETGLPFFETKKDLDEFSKFLQGHHILMVFKLHHLQAELPVFKSKFENILIMNDDMLRKSDIQLYQFLTFADALITDYSSVYTDYLLLDRPVVFTLDDYDDYSRTRGFYPPNAIDYLKGYHVYDKHQLEDSLIEILSGVDKYKNSRQQAITLYHTYRDGNSAYRVLQVANISK